MVVELEGFFLDRCVFFMNEEIFLWFKVQEGRYFVCEVFFFSFCLSCLGIL